MSSRPVVAATAACSGLRPVGLRVVHQIDTRHRQSGASAELAHEPDKFGRSAIIDLLSSIHRKHELVGPPVTEQVHRDGYNKAITMPSGPPRKYPTDMKSAVKPASKIAVRM
jgi:hypothetical protein